MSEHIGALPEPVASFSLGESTTILRAAVWLLDRFGAVRGDAMNERNT